MPYSITTKDGITIQNIPDEEPADSPRLRERVAQIRAQMNPQPTEREKTLSSLPMRFAKGMKDGIDGEIEVDESYFGGHRKGNRGRGAGGKVPVFGLLKRGGKVYTKVISDASSATLIPIIERKIVPDSIVYSDCWRAYNALDIAEFKHYRINHSKLFADKGNHINGIENFWKQAKRHLRKFNSIYQKAILSYF